MTPWIAVAFFFVALCAAAGGIGVLLYRLLARIERLQTIVVTSAHPPAEAPPGAFDFIKERPPLDAKGTLDFWRGVHDSPWWQSFAHMMQVETRTRLVAANSYSADGKETAAAFQAGAAWFASQLAVRPNAEVQAAVKRLQAEAHGKALEAAAQVDYPRPGKF